jgi:hypothetical protein
MDLEVNNEAFCEAMGKLPDRLKSELGRYHLEMLKDRPSKCLIRTKDHEPSAPLPTGYTCYLIEGDLKLNTTIDLAELNADGVNGNVVFIVAGNLTCERLIQEWASMIAVGGELTVHELFFAAKEDSTVIVSGDLDVWCYIGIDMWIEAGSAVDMTYAIGYALPIGHANLKDEQIFQGQHSEEETYAMLGYKDQEELYDLELKLESGDVASFKK